MNHSSDKDFGGLCQRGFCPRRLLGSLGSGCSGSSRCRLQDYFSPGLCLISALRVRAGGPGWGLGWARAAALRMLEAGRGAAGSRQDEEGGAGLCGAHSRLTQTRPARAEDQRVLPASARTVLSYTDASGASSGTRIQATPAAPAAPAAPWFRRGRGLAVAKQGEASPRC